MRIALASVPSSERPADIGLAQPQILVRLLPHVLQVPYGGGELHAPMVANDDRRSDALGPPLREQRGAAQIHHPCALEGWRGVAQVLRLGMTRRISQRELRNDSGEIMRELDRGESFVVTRNGVPVGELRPIQRQRFVPASVAVAAVATGAPIDAARFRTDVDRELDQDPVPRG